MKTFINTISCTRARSSFTRICTAGIGPNRLISKKAVAHLDPHSGRAPAATTPMSIPVRGVPHPAGSTKVPWSVVIQAIRQWPHGYLKQERLYSDRKSCATADTPTHPPRGRKTVLRNPKNQSGYALLGPYDRHWALQTLARVRLQTAAPARAKIDMPGRHALYSGSDSLETHAGRGEYRCDQLRRVATYFDNRSAPDLQRFNAVAGAARPSDMS